ncbi:MAG: SusC/RagA family TonB-linked outer membrane protein [Bacteroidales bacterium]
MKKITLLLAGFIFMSLQVLQAQNRTITGTVTDEEGSTMPGVSVVVLGTTSGTTTDSEGKFNLTISSDADSLRFSFVGFKTQVIPITASNQYDVSMISETRSIEGVVVTALGIKRSQKKLGYATSSVGSDELTKTQTPDAITSLQGKIAGVNINSVSGQPTASSSVILRGYSSINGSNQPLYVIDGSPITNSSNNQSSALNNQLDFGNGASSIDPANIESINILKGAAATALYGSRAANGVIMITTKSGSEGQPLRVNFSSSATFTTPLRLPQLQNTFGQGWSGAWASNENGSWGPHFDGKERLWGNTVDNSRLLKPFEAQENNLREFFDVGQSYKNSISISAGGHNSSFYASYGNTYSDGFVPTTNDMLNRHSFNVKGSVTSNRLTVSGNINYIHRDASTIAAGQGGDAATLFQDIMQIPRDLSIVDMEDYTNKFYNINNFYTPYATNPYFIINENGNDMGNDRVYGNFHTNFKITDDLDISWRIGQDADNNSIKIWNAIARPEDGSPNSTKQDIFGNVIEQSTTQKELNSDLTLNYIKSLNKTWEIGGVVGWNVNSRYFKRHTSEVTSLDIPNFYNLANSSEDPQANTYMQQRRLYGIYGQGEVAYNDYLFLTMTARNDWSSTLPEDNNSFFYPGVTLSFLATDAIPVLADFSDFMKFRAAWGKTGNDAAPYLINSVIIPSNVRFGFGEFNFPLGGVNAFEISNLIGNPNLEPEITTELEFGIDFRFLENRLGLDVAYYNRTTDGQIFQVPLASSTGYRSQTLNFGEVSNKGVELQLLLTPIKTTDFRWDIRYNFAKNNNEVLKLPEGLDQVVINGAYGIDFVAEEGKPIGVYYGEVAKTTDDGKIIVDANGIPKTAADKEEYGTAERDFAMGLNNSFTYKDFNLSFSLDYRKGGMMYAYTARINYFVGNATNTIYNDREPFIVPNSVQEFDTDGDGTPDTYEENTEQIDRANIFTYWNQTDNNMISQEHVLDKTFLKLRDITFSYNLPDKWFSNIPVSSASFGLYGRNLIIWTPEENNFVDPEMSTFGNDLFGAFGEFAGAPSARSFGFNLNVTF